MSDNNKKMIALEAMIRKIWKNRKVYMVVLPVTLILSYLVIASIPRYYESEVCLAPESSAMSGGGSLGAMASMMGMGSLGKLGSNVDAINSELYPDLLQSNDFLVKLMPVIVENVKKDTKCNYYTYIRDKQKFPWWSEAMQGLLGLFSKKDVDSYNGQKEISVFNLTEQQKEIFDKVKINISCSVDRKTDVITITVKDQDALICATMANKTCEKLQEFIIDYRTQKARNDYEYYKKLCAEAKSKYERARQLYGSYSDANMNVLLESYKSKLEDLENDMQLKYNMYSSLNTQMQMAQAKLQESTPAFTTIKSASVPVKPAGPKRLSTSIIYMILAFFVTSAIILRHDIKNIFF